MTREQMQTEIIRLYGFEHTVTIQFFELCEKLSDSEFNNKVLQTLVEAHKAYPVRD